MREERKAVTALFAHLVGSTALGETLDPEEAKLIVDRVALIPLGYGRAMAYVKPWVHGWWELEKTSSSFADLIVDADPQRAKSS